MIRPELRATFLRWREVIAAGICALFGGRLIWMGGYVLAPLIFHA